MKKFFTICFLIMLFVPAFSFLYAQEGKNIGDLIDDKGYLKEDVQYTGTVNMDGWNLFTDTKGTPYFRPGNNASPDYPIPGDEKWDTKYGLPGVTGYVHTLVYTGTLTLRRWSIQSYWKCES